MKRQRTQLCVSLEHTQKFFDSDTRQGAIDLLAQWMRENETVIDNLHIRTHEYMDD